MAFFLGAKLYMNNLETELSHVPQFQFVHEHLFSSGQPSGEQFKLMKEYGVDTVINLSFSDNQPHLAGEDKLCATLGLNYIQVPIDWGQPSDEQCLFVLDLIDYLTPQKIIWVHCGENLQCSSLMYLYRQYFMDMNIATAHELLHQVWQPNETWTGLMHAVGLQLQGRKATLDLQHSLMRADQFS